MAPQGPSAAEGAAADPGQVQILIVPTFKIEQVQRGTTAGDIIRSKVGHLTAEMCSLCHGHTCVQAFQKRVQASCDWLDHVITSEYRRNMCPDVAADGGLPTYEIEAVHAGFAMATLASSSISSSMSGYASQAGDWAALDLREPQMLAGQD